MALRFSRVTISSYDQKATFLVSGSPEDQDDLTGWTAFSDFLDTVGPDDMCTIHVETFLYGDEEVFDATPEEVAYFMSRIRARPDFIEKRTRKISESDIFLSLKK